MAREDIYKKAFQSLLDGEFTKTRIMGINKRAF